MLVVVVVVVLVVVLVLVLVLVVLGGHRGRRAERERACHVCARERKRDRGSARAGAM